MPRPKSLLIPVEYDQAKKSHNCQANAQHRINNGDWRMKVKKGRGWDCYCLACGKAMLEHAIARGIALMDKYATISNQCAESPPPPNNPLKSVDNPGDQQSYPR